MTIEWLPLIEVSLKSVATVCACAGLGGYARSAGLLPDQVEKGLDKLVAGIFLPCLILSKVTPHMNPRELYAIWPLMVMCMVMVVYGLVAGALMSGGLQRIYPKAFPKFRGLLMVAMAFPNSFSVPMTLLLNLGDNPVLLADGQAGGDVLRTRVNLLFLMSYSIWVLARWSIGFPILTGAITFSDWKQKVLNPPVVACLFAGASGLAWFTIPTEYRPEGAGAQIFQVFVVPLSYAGRCSVPIILFQLGAKLHAAVLDVFSRVQKKNIEPLLSSKSEEQGAGDDVVMPFLAYLSVLVFRQLGGSILAAIIAIGVLKRHCGVTDPVVLMIAMLQSAGPPMINLSVMAGLTGSAKLEVAKLLLFTYVISIGTWTCSIVFFLHLLSV